MALLLGDPAVLLGDAIASGENPLNRILHDWRTRQRDIQAVRFEVRGNSTWMRGSFGEPQDPVPGGPDASTPNPDRDTTGAFSLSILLAPASNRYWSQGEAEHYDPFSREMYTMAGMSGTDGQIAWSRILQATEPGLGAGLAQPHADLVIMRGEPEVMMTLSDYRKVVLLYGFGVVRAGGARIRATRLIPEVDESWFSFRGWRTHGERRYAVVGERITDFWVDLEKQSAIERVVINEQDPRLIAEIGSQRTPVGWLPENWELWRFRQGTLYYHQTAVVETVDTQPAADHSIFTFRPERGMVVAEEEWLSDGAGGVNVQKSFYRVGARGRFIKLDENFYPLSRAKIWQWLLMGMIGLGPVLYFWLWRRGGSSP